MFLAEPACGLRVKRKAIAKEIYGAYAIPVKMSSSGPIVLFTFNLSQISSRNIGPGERASKTTNILDFGNESKFSSFIRMKNGY